MSYDHIATKAISITPGAITPAQAYRSGNVCVIVINYYGNAIAGNTVAFTIGENDRPNSYVCGVLTGIDDTDGKTATIEIDYPTGVAYLKVGISSNKRFQGEIVYIAP